jgi:choline dehydrogenase-like flavoprotein
VHATIGQAFRGARSCRSRCLNYPHRENYLDLDPDYRDAYGQPLLRLTYNFRENDYRMSEYVTNKAHEIARASGATLVGNPAPRRGDFDARVYQTTHTTGGTSWARTRGRAWFLRTFSTGMRRTRSW